MYNDCMANMDPEYVALQQMIVDLSFVKRGHNLANTTVRENDVEHSMMVALLCWYLYEKLQPDLDLTKVLKYAMCHDFVEQYAGDVSTFASADARLAKSANEAVALRRIEQEHAAFSDLTKTMADYERKHDEESKFVWTIDKMQTLIMGDMDEWRPYIEVNTSYQTFSDKYNELLAQSSRYCKEIFRELIAYCQTTYYDRPK